MGTSYIPFPPWAIFFYLVPLWMVWLNEKSYGGIFWTGCLTQFVFTFIGFNWVAHTVHEFGHLPWVASIFVLMLFCLCANLYLPVTGLVWFWLCRVFKLEGLRRLWLLPVLLCIAERIAPMIFDWHVGYTWLWAKFPGYHLADIVGFIGLANITVAINGLLLTAWWRAKAHRRWWTWAMAAPVLFLALNLAGWLHGKTWPEPDRQVKIMLLQANIGNQEKLESEKGGAYRDVVIERWMSMTHRALKESPADFAVWPETAFPDLITDRTLSGFYAAKIKAGIIESQTKLIAGAFSQTEPNGRYSNSFFMIGADGNWITPPYHKTILLAFGEYFPFGEQFPWLKRMFPEVGDLKRGSGPTVLDSGQIKIGAQVCYEGLFDWFSRALANQGAQVIVNLTNDSWYGKWEEPFQHGWMTFARAVEVRRPLVRSTNTGVSSVALATGEIMELSPLHEEWFHLYNVPYYSQPRATIFMSWGFWLIPALLGLSLLGILLSRSKRDL